jgi:hypothetical protein
MVRLLIDSLLSGRCSSGRMPRASLAVNQGKTGDPESYGLGIAPSSPRMTSSVVTPSASLS